VTEFCMPSLGADMDEGTVLEWRVKPGDPVQRGDIILVVDTEKAEIEVEIWQSGVVDRILVQPGAKVPVGTPLATLGSAAERSAPKRELAEPPPAREPAAPVPAAPAPVGPGAPARAEPVAAPSAPAVQRTQRVRASPLARRIAGQLGVDLGQVEGTGPEGGVTARDVEAAAEARTPAPTPRAPPGNGATARVSERLVAMRRGTAKAMARSKREIPHYYLEETIDLSRALDWLEETNRERPVTERILPAALLIKAVAGTLEAAPELNGHWVDGGFRPSAEIHVGVAVSLRGGGLLAPALRDVDRRPLPELMAGLRDLVARARRAQLRSSEVTSGTITVTNLGDQGVSKVFGVIYPPQVALVGFGKVGERPWAEDGLLGVRRAVTATLSADHRASDGIRGARFLARLGRRLADPESL